MSYKIICVIGTRPEYLKMAPVIEILSKNPAFEVKTVVTAQHRSLVDQIDQHFSIKIDTDFDVMTDNQSLAELNAKLLIKFNDYFEQQQPDLVIAQGDTTTTMTAAMSAYYQQIRFAHIEAGLRTNDINSPYPEEMNRQIIARIADIHFAATIAAKHNLHKEGIHKNIFVTGNTIIDTLYHFAKQDRIDNDSAKKIILVTCHRRENFGKPLLQICEALKRIAYLYPDFDIVFPVHPNPNLQQTIYDILSDINNIKLIQPLSYPDLVAKLTSCYLVLTDSGGIQEEAPALGKPVLVLREQTERTEGVLAGSAKLVGTNTQTIIEDVSLLIDDNSEYNKMANVESPYGDGQAAIRINYLLEEYFHNDYVVSDKYDNELLRDGVQETTLIQLPSL